ncbi:uncharacterized protein LOC129599652 [Paramacrobiotus metropolitanus]|uniref:uncharacterized protein LOC129599652 n=1 Tax=Paramacrobiotus metropolitanus TaxID=2943436 RepID=UPI002445CAE8|nr:uncharacterized protein LOC129599652 [Paramacrobiotus metropolitanus]
MSYTYQLLALVYAVGGVLYLCSNGKNVSAEVFSSMADVETLITTEKLLLDVLQNFLREERLALAETKRYIRRIKRAKEDELDVEAVTMFQRTKLLLEDISPIKMSTFTEHHQTISSLRVNRTFPEEADMEGSADAFARLQLIYRLHPRDIARGRIPGTRATMPFTSQEAFIIGHNQAVNGFFNSAAAWLEIALELYREETKHTGNLAEILDWLQYAVYRDTKNAIRALDFLREIVGIESRYPNLAAKRRRYEEDIRDFTREQIAEFRGAPNATQVYNSDSAAMEGFVEPAERSYQELCRGEQRTITTEKCNLKCHYRTYGNPYLIIQPVKVEIVHSDPEIVVIRNAILDFQAVRVRQVGYQHLLRSQVMEPDGKNKTSSKHRIAKIAFLPEDLDPVIGQINRYIGHATNLDPSTAEELQVNNYGIGGHYSPHFDFFENIYNVEDYAVDEKDGDRVATCLIYMTNVEAGGATVFPRLNLTLVPEKGSAAFWYNKFRDGSADVRTLHAGCPVLSGMKWVSNKWFRERGQEWRRPCGIRPDGYANITEISEMYNDVFTSVNRKSTKMSTPSGLYIMLSFVFLTFWHSSSAELFSSMAHMETLLATEKLLLEILGSLMRQERLRLTEAKAYNNVLKSETEDNFNSTEDNPTKMFRRIKHLTRDFGYISDLIAKDVFLEHKKRIKNLRDSEVFPDEKDLEGSAEAFARLQLVYKLDPPHIARGHIPGTRTTMPFTSQEAFIIGQYQAKINLFDSAAAWLEVALELHHEEEPKTSDLAEVLDWLQYAMYEDTGNAVRALEIIQHIRIIQPSYPNLELKAKLYEAKVWELSHEQIRQLRNAPSAIEEYSSAASDRKSDAYESLCRGKDRIMPEIKKRLTCYFKTYGNPYLLLQPIRIEMAYDDPEVLIIHNAFSASQAQRIRELGKEHLSRGLVMADGNTNRVVSQHRIAKVAFLENLLDPVIAEVNRYIGHATNLDLTTAEDLQVNNYGIGGHYVPHYDFFENPWDPGKYFFEHGDRIATCLLYMTDVDAGGATVFPRLNLTLVPEKGTAAFWYNKFKDGSPDVRTLHSGCPVLSGMKWVSNKWFKERGQEWRRPCGLQRDGVVNVTKAVEEYNDGY